MLERVEETATRAASFAEDQALATIGRNPLNGFYYRFDDNKPSAVHDDSLQQSSTERFLASYEFDMEDLGSPGFHPVFGDFSVRDGVLRVDEWKADDYAQNTDSLEIPITHIGEIELRLKVRKGTHLDLRVSTVEGPDWEGLSDLRPLHRWGDASLPIIADNKFHTYRIQAQGLFRRTSGKAAQHLRLKSVFLKPTNEEGDTVEIDYLRIYSKRAKYAREGFGSAYVNIDSEFRKVLFANSPIALDYPVDLPDGKITLEFGMGILMNDDPVTFDVEIECQEDGTSTLFSAVVSEADKWSEARVDLARCSGKSAMLRFRVTADGGNVAFWSNPEVYAPPHRQFNVIIVLEDALRADHMSCYGYPRKTTPFKDLLFKHGMVFEHAFSQATKTRPSVPSIMTSLYPTATGVWQLSDRLDDAYLTLAEIMRHQGFVTAAFIQNENAGPYAGLQQGFGQLRGTGKADPELAYGPLVREWIDAHKHRNMFLYLHILDPHGRYDPPEKFRGWWRTIQFRGIRVDHNPRFDPEWDSTPSVEGRRARYDGEIRNNDYYFEGLVTWLKQRALFENTLLVFIADHGEHLGEHELWEHSPPGYIQVLHVPLLMSYPARFGSGIRFSQPVQVMDVMPTILELADVDTAPLILQGQSLMPLIRRDSSVELTRRVVASDEVVRRKVLDEGFWGSLFFDGWHLLNTKDRDVQVFNYLLDPNENRADTSEIALQIMRSGVDEYMEAIQRLNIGIWGSVTRDKNRTIDYDVEVVEQLRELGYVE